MPKRRKNVKTRNKRKRRLAQGGRNNDPQEIYAQARRLAEHGQHDEARALYGQLQSSIADPKLKALVANDLGALQAAQGNFEAALANFESALTLNEQCE